MSGKAIRPLGELELAVMEAIWSRDVATVKDVGLALEDRGLAYTTLMTTMDRLFKKGLLEREKHSHSFLYRAAMDRATYERRLTASVLHDLSTTSPEAILSGFLDFAATDEGTLEALERLLAERKRGQS